MNRSTIHSIVLALVLAFSSIFLAHSALAQTDACGTVDPATGNEMNGLDSSGNPTTVSDPPGCTSSGIGGYCGNNKYGSAQNQMQNSLTHRVSAAANAKHQMVSNSQSISAQLHYCFSTLSAIFASIGGVGVSLNKAIIMGLIYGIIKTAIATLCGMVISTITSTISKALTLVDSLMCLPIPKFKMPSFRLPNLPSAKCHGLALGTVSLTQPNGVTNNTSTNKLLWTLWGGKLNVKVQQ